MIKELLTQKIKIASTEGKALKSQYNIPDTADEFIRKFYICEVEKGKDKQGEEDGTTVAYISTKDIDRDGEVLEPEGAELKFFRKNPVVMFGHDYSQLPVGKAQWIKTDEKGLIAKTEWAPTQLGEDLKKLYNNGFMRAFSVGFIPREWVDGDKDGEPKRTYKKWDLLEYSAVPVPANPYALALASAEGIVKSKSLQDIFQALSQKPDDRPPTVVQTLIFDKKIFETAESAKKWARDHDFKDDKVDETEDSWRLRQRDPGDFDPDSFRTIELAKGVKAVVGHLKKEIEQQETASLQAQEVKSGLKSLRESIDILLEKLSAIEKDISQIKETNQKSIIKIKDEESLRISAEEVPKIKEMIEEAIRSEVNRLTGKVS